MHKTAADTKLHTLNYEGLNWLSIGNDSGYISFAGNM